MSAFASLFGGATAATATKDSELDALFAKTKSAEVPKVKAKAKPPTSGSSAGTVKPPEEILQAAQLAKSRAKASGSTAVKPDVTATDGKSKRKAKSQKEKSKAVAAAAAAADDSEDDQVVEESYAVKKAKKGDVKGSSKSAKSTGKAKEMEAVKAIVEEGQDEESSESEAELVHETVLKARSEGAAAPSPGKAKKLKAPVDESPADRDARTTFIGNVAVIAATNKSTRKALVRHLISTLPSAPVDYPSLIRLESIRFRSLQLNAPVPLASGTKGDAAPTPSNPNEIDITQASTAASESRARKRARQWRENEGGDDEADEEAAGAEGGSAGGKGKFLTAAQKRKVAFIKGELHGKASSCNAYAVWTTIPKPSPSADEAAVTPKQLAELVVKHANNTTFEGLTLRVDTVRSNGSTSDEPQQAGAEKGSLEYKKQVAAELKRRAEEEKRTLYLGSLDFEETEENVRKLCEKLMTEERGEPPAPTGASTTTWVERVRVIKDPETGLGKGFAYVLFKDRECIDEMLALDPVRVKLSKRKLRLERCNTSKQGKKAGSGPQTGAGKTSSLPSKAADKAEARAGKLGEKGARGSAASAKPKAALPNINLSQPMKPRPDVGDTLRDLSKDDRKALKSSDAERLQRRLEKKQRTRLGIQEAKSKELIDKKLRFANDGRKVGSAGAGAGKGSRAGGEGKKRSRVRSDTSVMKKNSKKADA